MSSGNPIPTLRDNLSVPSSQPIDLEDRTGRFFPKRRRETAFLRCVKSQKSAGIVSGFLLSVNYDWTVA